MGRIEQLMQFVESNPNDPFPRYGLALELRNAGRLEDAERAFTELMSRFPDYTPAYLHAGNLLAALKKRDDAEAVYAAGIAACDRKRPPDRHAQGELEAALATLRGDGELEDD
jgi:tetratricopeptide (TPR) repeat protein